MLLSPLPAPNKTNSDHSSAINTRLCLYLTSLHSAAQWLLWVSRILAIINRSMACFKCHSLIPSLIPSLPLFYPLLFLISRHVQSLFRPRLLLLFIPDPGDGLCFWAIPSFIAHLSLSSVTFDVILTSSAIDLGTSAASIIQHLLVFDVSFSLILQDMTFSSLCDISGVRQSRK